MLERFGYLPAFLIVFAGTLGACAESSEGSGSSGDGGTVSDAGSRTTDAGTTMSDGGPETDGGVVLPPPTCAMGAPVPEIIGTSVDEDCAGRLAERTFRYAVCSCGDIGGTSGLYFDAYDSRVAPYAGPDGEGAAVGANGEVTITSGEFSAAGTLRAAGGFRTTSGTVTIEGDLFLGSELRSTAGTFAVRRDAWINGDIASEVSVDRDLTYSGMIRSPMEVTVTGTTAQASFTVPPPCPCETQDLIDVAGLVGEASTTNDNTTVAFDAASIEGGRDDVELPCGRLFVDSVSFSSRRIFTRGRTMLFVNGSVRSNSGGFLGAVEGGELDIFINGDLTMTTENTVGHLERPANVRVYVSGRVGVTSDNTIAANIYAPRAELSLTSGNEVFGSVFVADLNSTSETRFHYDRAITDAGDICEPPTGQCNGCEDCSGGQTCLDSVCRTCMNDSDCCAPLVCNPDGSCGILLF